MSVIDMERSKLFQQKLACRVVYVAECKKDGFMCTANVAVVNCSFKRREVGGRRDLSYSNLNHDGRYGLSNIHPSHT